MPDPNSPWHPEAFAAISMSALERAFWMEQCAHAARYMIAHSNPPGLSEDQLAQRKVILGICAKLFQVQRDVEMDEATAQWKDYRANA